MIKDLINDIAHDSINLTQSLTRAKLIAYKINNEEFKLWLSQELDGYRYGKDVPKYRILEVETVGEVMNPLGRTYEVQIELDPSIKKNLDDNPRRWHYTEGITSLERSVALSKGGFTYFLLGPEAAEVLSQCCSLPYATHLKHVMKKIPTSLIYSIKAKTNQKLLDSLLKLDSEFPDLENEIGTMEDKTKANQIINNTIHGNVSNTNFGLGETVNQEKTINQSQFLGAIDQLSSLGVEKEDLDNLKDIVTNEDKISVAKKILTWIGKIAQKTIEKKLNYKFH